MKKIIIASDHAGYSLKEYIKIFLIKEKLLLKDIGTKDEDSVDYPDYAHKLSKIIKRNRNTVGVLICGSGQGMIMTANKHKNIRAALCYNIRSTKLSRKHNNANVIAIGSRLTKKNLALKCVSAFLKTNFSAGRHLRRLKKI